MILCNIEKGLVYYGFHDELNMEAIKITRSKEAISKISEKMKKLEKTMTGNKYLL